jgi:hypothetical protein
VNAKFFEEQRREMVAAIRARAEHMAPEIGKTALDARVLRAMAQVPRQVDTTASEQPGFRELGISPRSLETGGALVVQP